MQRYRSGHNGPDSKSGEEQSSVGSNPTRCARSPAKKIQSLPDFFSQNPPPDFLQTSPPDFFYKNRRQIRLSFGKRTVSFRYTFPFRSVIILTASLIEYSQIRQSSYFSNQISVPHIEKRVPKRIIKKIKK